MIKKVGSSPILKGTVAPPGDKSISHRALIFNAMAEGEARISNLSPGADCLSTVSCLRALGVEIQLESLPLLNATVAGVGRQGFREPEEVLDAGNSATTMRLMAGLLAALPPFLSVITGDGSLRSRPMDRVVQPLRLMGGNIWGRGNDSLAPLAFRGARLHGMEYSLPVASAQVKSAIMLSALFAQGDTTLKEPSPSRDHSERLLQSMGAKIEKKDSHINIRPLTQPLRAITLRVPGDLSSAAYWLVAGAAHPNARIEIRECGVNPTRTGIIEVLQAMGARLQVKGSVQEGNEPIADIVVESSNLHGIEIGGEIIPRIIDDIPALAVAACLAQGTTVIRGAAELRVKESDRLKTTAMELSKLGAEVRELPDGLIIQGGKRLRGTSVRSHGDHRMAMTLAIAGLIGTGETRIYGAEAAGISYPGFWHDLENLISSGGQ